MCVYRRGVDEKGVSCEQLRATHTIQGITAKASSHVFACLHCCDLTCECALQELCDFYFNPEVRLEWEST